MRLSDLKEIVKTFKEVHCPKLGEKKAVLQAFVDKHNLGSMNTPKKSKKEGYPKWKKEPFYEGDIVSHKGKNYKALDDGFGDEPPSANWKRI